MTRDEKLARLVADAAEGRSIPVLLGLVEEASEQGAERALHRLGLSDDNASADIADLRELLTAWRTAKTSAWKAVVEWLVRGVLALLLVGIAMRMGVAELLKRARLPHSIQPRSVSPAMPHCSAAPMRRATRSAPAPLPRRWRRCAMDRCRYAGSIIRVR